LKLEDKLYWGRFLGGILMGFLTYAFRLYEPTIWIGIAVMILVYFASAVALRLVLSDEKQEELGRKLYLSGAGTYVVMWLITLVIVANVLPGFQLA